MTNPIAPPPELVQQWVAEIWHEGTPVRVSLSDEHIATRAAQWGADQELEACCEYLVRCAQWEPEDIAELRAARRPKPPTLKEQAQQALSRFDNNAHTAASEMVADFDTIRRALEALPE